jgi:hypothetical protein
MLAVVAMRPLPLFSWRGERKSMPRIMSPIPSPFILSVTCMYCHGTTVSLLLDRGVDPSQVTVPLLPALNFSRRASIGLLTSLWAWLSRSSTHPLRLLSRSLPKHPSSQGDRSSSPRSYYLSSVGRLLWTEGRVSAEDVLRPWRAMPRER